MFNMYRFIIYKNLYTLPLIRNYGKRLGKRRDYKTPIYVFFKLYFGNFPQFYNGTVMRISCTGRFVTHD